MEPVQATVEPDLVYPLLRGRDVTRWQSRPSAHLIMTQDPDTRRGIPVADMKRRYPKTFAYLKRFESHLRKRSGYKKYFKPDDPFYCVYNVGSYTLAPWKVAWRDMGNRIQVAVVEAFEGRPVCPEHHAMAVVASNEAEAHFLSGALMSSPVQLLVAGYTTTTGISTHVLEHVAVPKYDPKDSDHREVAQLAAKCRRAAREEKVLELRHHEDDLDKSAARLWGITSKELHAIQDEVGGDVDGDADAPALED